MREAVHLQAIAALSKARAASISVDLELKAMERNPKQFELQGVVEGASIHPAAPTPNRTMPSFSQIYRNRWPKCSGAIACWKGQDKDTFASSIYNATNAGIHAVLAAHEWRGDGRRR